MSVGLSIQFLTGRYHATPWDHQVNEGVVEFPPSPWRILRSLVSAYYRLPELPDRALMNQLLSRLANHLPSYALPSYTAAHTRHYMPIRKEGKVTTTKVLDTFYVFPGGALSRDAEIQVIWAGVNLSLPEQQLLQNLCQQVSYLGRAESWVEMRVVAESKHCNATPLEERELNPKAERIKVLAPLTIEGLKGFQSALEALPKPKKGKVKWKAPADILEALELDIANLHGQNWNGIPGTRWVPYELESVKQKTRSQYSLVFPPNFARFALSSNVLPRLTEAVSLGDRFRKALIFKSKDDEGLSDPIFVGRNFKDLDEEGNAKPAEGQQHAWYLPEVNPRTGRIEHVIVYAAGGFGEQAISALCGLKKVWGTEGFDVQTILVSLGDIKSYSNDKKQPGCSWLVGKSCKWKSLTPLVLPRHPKEDRRGNPKYISGTSFQVDGPEHQTLRLLSQLLNQLSHNFSLDKCIEIQCAGGIAGDWLGYQNDDGTVLVKARCLSEEAGRQFSGYRWQAFQRRRYQGKGDKVSDRGYWLEIEFAESQMGPIALGYAAHFGLGLFVPIDLSADE